MATTTPNYGWTVPTSTDLVKDGATAIETLGDAVDATVYANANAAINKTIVDAKGDLIAATAADTVARLASSGVNDQVLTIDTSTATGLKWATAAGGGMTLLSTTTLSGVTTTISSINQTYQDLLISISGFTVSTANPSYYQIKDSSGTGLYGSLWGGVSNVGAVDAYNLNAFYALPDGSNNKTTGGNNAYVIYIKNYATSEGKPFQQFGYITNSAYSNSTAFNMAGSLNVGNAVSQITFGNYSAATFGAGTVKIYGVK